MDRTHPDSGSDIALPLRTRLALAMVRELLNTPQYRDLPISDVTFDAVRFADALIKQLGEPVEVP